MRIETDYNIFIATILLLLIVFFLSKANVGKKAYRITLVLVAGITMPSFVPGHGEIIMLIPTAGLLVIDSLRLKVIGIIFVLINSFIAWLVLNKAANIIKRNGNNER